jgi:hypothetical protein
VIHAKEDIENAIRLSTWDVIKLVIYKWASPRVKLPAALQIPKAPEGVKINHIAVILDGRVEEVIHTENRMAALLLSEPHFVQFPDSQEMPTIGWLYENNKFYKTLEEKLNETNQVPLS